MEIRYYRFDLSGGGSGILTGEPMPLPEDLDLRTDGPESEDFEREPRGGDVFCGYFLPGAIVDGDVIRYWVQVTDGTNNGPDLVNTTPLHIDWDAVVVNASCQVHCDPSINLLDPPSSLEDCCDDPVIGEVCKCEPLPCIVSDPDYCTDGVGHAFQDASKIIGCHQILNPLP